MIKSVFGECQLIILLDCSDVVIYPDGESFVCYELRLSYEHNTNLGWELVHVLVTGYEQNPERRSQISKLVSRTLHSDYPQWIKDCIVKFCPK